VEALLAGHLEELLPGQEERRAGLAAHLAFLLEGAMVRAGLEGGDGRLLQGRTIAARMLDGL
ncbi:MAG: TetR/AcrR family transcriptional regulator, partial [Pseudarthrobacter sp.]|nr:TetR/AcrR family transcriptional regulator [Pseudarthrobacter sp.]